MSMHLEKGLSTLKTTKIKKPSQADIKRLKEEHRLYNKEMRQKGVPSLQKTFDEYVNFAFGKATQKPKKTEYNPKPAAFHRETPNYPSAGNSIGVAPKKENTQYTGTLVKGICQTHKSNAVPVIDEQHILDIARMRR